MSDSLAANCWHIPVCDFCPTGCSHHGLGFTMGQPVWLPQMQNGWTVQPERHGKELPWCADV